ncbi:predicted protein [Phaeodactylum tricornutum CCAP 1055/1]|jgi:lysophospholipase L1-like esterase|uniref:Uncharacterized protein n=2 Tax=Phaeodactylum tricornutum TaxID=2850 RepID=B7G8M6_PHATC|nr:predicted protein [Phaeodactylum tricornutum CCAP 1055/1]EEC45197.1 predicted protein [Phaeodactylum tricornutum CCAP 1055/1]|eukprot:XP_002183497.1 predicted protein [Phaeodactylum tricornutum CCAP 1055/1]
MDLVRQARTILLLLVTACLWSHWTRLQILSASSVTDEISLTVNAGNSKRPEQVKTGESCSDFSKIGSFRRANISLTGTLDGTRTTAAQEDGAMCGAVASRSALGLWGQHFDHILKASRLRKDRFFVQHNMMLEILKMISPRLPMSTQSTPREWDLVGSVLRKGWRRYQFLQDEQLRKNHSHNSMFKEPDIVNIVVLGGSVTEGVNCYAIKGNNLVRCAWPGRLELLINRLAGGKLVKVHNLANGGTNTLTGQAILKYDLLPELTKHPDILINAYSTNDMHISTMRSAAGEETSLRDTVFRMAQSFARLVMDPTSCGRRPLLLWLDDYVGNEQREIKGITQLSQEIQVLSNYYGFSFISYANVVRDWIYGDTHGSLFSPSWYTNGRFVRQIHPGQVMHLATSWIMAYNLLELATAYCTTELWNDSATANPSTDFPQPVRTPGQEKLFDSMRYQPKPNSLPPYLTDHLSLTNVTDEWNKAAQVKKTICPTDNEGTRCIFSWISGVDRKETVNSIQSVFSSIVKIPGAWDVGDDTGRKKYGWNTSLRGSQLLFEFTGLNQTVQTVTLFPMKSYSEKWRESTAVVEFFAKPDSHLDWAYLTSLVVQGFHFKNTSEMYTIPVKMPTEVAVRADFRVRLTLTNGTTFKLMGLAVCS